MASSVVYSGKIDPELAFSFSDETWFYLDGHWTQNSRCCTGQQNIHILHTKFHSVM